MRLKSSALASTMSFGLHGALSPTVPSCPRRGGGAMALWGTPGVVVAFSKPRAALSSALAQVVS
eukprot:6331367-Pyramimonas_sp.AAC.1